MEVKKFGPELKLKTARYLMLMITTKFMILACFMIALGLAVYSYYHSFAFFEEGIKTGRFITPSLITFLLGIFLLVVTLFGFFGTLKQSTCLVNLVIARLARLLLQDQDQDQDWGVQYQDQDQDQGYWRKTQDQDWLSLVLFLHLGNTTRHVAYALLLGLMLLLKVVVVILASTLDPFRLREALNIPISRYVSDLEIEMEINQIQESLNCCGSESFLDYVGMEFTNNQATVVAFASYQGHSVEVVVPSTCCIAQNKGICSNLRTRGCKTALIDMFMNHSAVIASLGICVTIMKVLGIIFALLLARSIRKAKSERGLMSWTITEQSILARQNEANQSEDQSTNEPDQSVNQPNHADNQSGNHQAITNGGAGAEVPTATLVVPRF